MNYYRIRLPGNDYEAKLVGVDGTPTQGLSVTGNYDPDTDMHVFAIQTTGRYQLYMRQDPQSNFVLDSNWGGSSGKIILGDDFDTHFNGHGKGPEGKIKPEETTFAAPMNENEEQ